MPQKVQCQICNKKFGCRQIFDHRQQCLSDLHQDKNGYLISMFSHGITGETYELHIIVNKKCKLQHLDNYLREIWCECCNHLSIFELYVDSDVITTSDNKKKKIKLVPFSMELPKKDMIAKYGIGSKIIYTYDMGSTTTIYIQIGGELNGKKKNNDVEIVYRNNKPLIKCDKCSKKARFFKIDIPLCKLCGKKSNKDNDSKSCDSDDDDDDLLKIVNSPRTGVCGYE